MYRYLLRFIFFCFWAKLSIANIKNNELKVAILDNFHSQMLPSEKYVDYYMQGISMAVEEAQESGIHIICKNFTYGTNSLGILESLSNLKEWSPDLVIGPRSSNQFLLLKNQFKNILVLSPYATSSQVANMPKNFYSLTPPDSVSVSAFFSFLLTKYPEKNIFVLSQGDCESCSQIAKSISKKYPTVNPKVKTLEYSILQSQANQIDVGSVLRDFDFKNGIVILPDMAWLSSIMMFRITNYAKMPVIFLGGDNWGGWKDGIVGKLAANYEYLAFRITPWSPDSTDPQTLKFKKAYLNKYHQEPDNISYIAYSTLSSVTAAIRKSPKNCVDRYSPSCVLEAYQNALNADENFFRSKTYYLYSVKTSGEKYLGPIFTANLGNTDAH